MASSGPRRTQFAIPMMDCPSEERLIRMALDGLDGVEELSFDLPGRTLAVTHRGEPVPVLAKLEPLGLVARAADSSEAGPSETAAPEARDEAGPLRLLLLAKHRHGGAHMRASWIFSTNDVLANLGVMAAGALVAATGSRIPDLVIGTAVAALVLLGAVRILRLR